MTSLIVTLRLSASALSRFFSSSVSLTLKLNSLRQRLYQTLLEIIAHKPVPERYGRGEPRVRKRRPKSYPVMKQPRESLRRQLKTA